MMDALSQVPTSIWVGVVLVEIAIFGRFAIAVLAHFKRKRRRREWRFDPPITKL